MPSSNKSHSTETSNARALGSLNHPLDAVFDLSPFILYSTSIENGSRTALTRSSAALSKVFGVSPMDAVKPDWWVKSIHPEDLRRTLEVYSGLTESQRITHQYRMRMVSGGYASIADTLVVMRGDAGMLIGLGFIEDLSNAEELKSQRLLIGRLANLGELATSLAHELVQPLNTIKVAAYNIRTKLEKGDGDLASHESRLDRITRQVDRAASLISHLKMFGRESEKERAPFKIEDAINGALELVENHFLLFGIKIFLKVPPTVPPLVGHQVLLEQVFLNLFLNVRDVVNQRKSRNDPVVHIEVMENSGVLEIKVLDNVGGIPESILPRIFEPFVTTKPVGEPGGLGLPISATIIKDMGGTLEADNVGEGACFTLRLPIVSPYS